MPLWKDHPKEIREGWVGGDFPSPFGRCPAAAWPPKPQDNQEQRPSSKKSKKKEDKEDEYKSRSWIKRALRLGETTPPRPGSYEFDAEQDALRKLKAESKKTHKPKATGRIFCNQRQEMTSQVDQEGRPVVPNSVDATRRPGRSTACRRPRAEPITSHWTAGLGVGGPGAGSRPPIIQQPAGREGHRPEVDSSGTNKALGGAPTTSRGYHYQ
ncbi:hypothetical protein M436DRAFT_84825 [Aureobasidium namibiae CBS 147.97]|uniref:Uncharacterized protein n=1 Tax=Aureobasidium namibiae CBS 147.97 TaxID=1043004 RepID=A0A074X6K9_9PEZI